MMKRFAVENYRNFKDRVEISFDKTRGYDFNKQYIKNGLLNKVIILGKNGSGKSNFGLAIFDIVMTLTDKSVHQNQIHRESFLNADNDLGYAIFEYEFYDNGKTIGYTYRKTAPNMIIYERLTVDGDEIFVRDGNESDYTILKERYAENLRIEVGDGPLSILRYVWANTVQNEESPISFIMDFSNRMLYFTSNPDGNTYIGFSKGSETLAGFIVDNGLEKDFQKLLSELGNMDLELDAFKPEQMPGALVQRFQRTGLDFQNIASTGTKTFMLFYYWSRKFKDVSFLYMDEFDSYYHYEMASNVLKYVANDSNFQTIFTTHNTSLIHNDVLRPDCYMTLEPNAIRSFADSTDRELRRGHNLEKMYRNGEFDE